MPLVFSCHQSVRPVILVGLRKASDWLSFSWESCGSRFCGAVVCRGIHLYYWAHMIFPKHPTHCFLARSRKLKNVWTWTRRKFFFFIHFFPFLSFFLASLLMLLSGINSAPHGFLSSAGMVGFLFMLRALVSANFNTIYIYTAEVGSPWGMLSCLESSNTICVYPGMLPASLGPS